LDFNKISEKFSRNGFFLKFHVRVWTEIGTKRDKFQVKRISIHLGKKSNSFGHKRTFLSGLAVTDKKFIASPVVGVWVLKLSRQNDQCLVKISDQNTQGVRRSKFRTESEQNWFSENRTSWLLFLESSICDLFMDVPP